MRRKLVYKVGALFVFSVVLGLFFWKATETTKTYIGINGEAVTLRGHFSSDFKLKPNSEQEIHRVGDVIKNEQGTDEVVCAISEDGSFMTVPVEDYEQMMDSINDTE